MIGTMKTQIACPQRLCNNAVLRAAFRINLFALLLIDV